VEAPPKRKADLHSGRPAPSQIPSPSTLPLFNGNTFAELGRGLSYALFADLAVARKKQIASLVAHFIAGVLDENAMLGGLNDLIALESFQVGDRVGTLRKSVSGTIVKIKDVGSIMWKTDGTGMLWTGTPQSLIRIRT
jgi:hypothetical protein